MWIQKFLNGIKISLFLLMMSAVNSYGMDLALPSKKEITFKSLEGIPCLKLSAIQNKWQRLPEEKRKQIQEQINNVKDDRLQALFNIATKLPKELQNEILKIVFNNNREATNKFLRMPIEDAVRLYHWAEKTRRNNSFKYLKEEPQWRNDLVFELSNGIRRLKQQSNCYGLIFHYKELKDVKIFYDTFKESLYTGFKSNEIYYKFYETYSLKNFMKHQSLNDWLLLPIFLAPFLARWIKLNISYKIFSKEIAQENEIKEVLNLFIKNQFNGTSNPLWLNYIFKIYNPYISTLASTYIEVIPLEIASVLCAYKIFNWMDSLTLAIMGGGVLYVCASVWLIREIISPELWIAGITISYIIIRSLLTIKEMGEVRFEQIEFKDISKLLLRKDIQIL